MIPLELTQLLQVFDLSTERLYPTTLGFSLCEAKILWLRLLFTDEAGEIGETHMALLLI